MTEKKKQHLPDHEARKKITERLDVNLLVEAAAGTGKTSSLVDRMLALIREGRTTVDTLAAVTFTRKAAAHLKQKFQQELEKGCREEQDTEKQGHLEIALQDLDRCFIGTIHSFCARLLRERPVEAGVNPSFEEIEEPENQELQQVYWEKYAEELVLQHSEVLSGLEELGVSLETLKVTYETMARYPDVEPVVVTNLPKPDFTSTRKAVSDFLSFAEQELPDRVPEKGWDALQQRIKNALRIRDHLDCEQDLSFIKLLESLNYRSKAYVTRWPDSERAKECQAQFDTLRDGVVIPALNRWHEYHYATLIDAVTPAIEDLQKERKLSGQLNFEDLLLLTRDMLKDYPAVREYFQRRFTHLLVDEYQDTDPIQAEVLLYLTGEDHQEKDAWKLRPRRGSLFVVGDPKQSIYRFRRADITTYLRFKEIMREPIGEAIQLETNFRSLPRLCNWVNQVFPSVFSESPSDKQAPYVALKPHRHEGEALSGVFRLSGTDKAGDADEIARWIVSACREGLRIAVEADEAEHCSRPVAYGDFLILHWRRQLEDYAIALEQYGIPYEISGGKAFSKSEDLAALVSLLRCLVDPDDSVALLAFLRGPFCGLDDNSLYQFKKAGGVFSYHAPLPQTGTSGIEEAFQFLLEARNWIQRLPPGAALSRIMDRRGILSFCAAQPLGETRSGNMLKVQSLARELSAQGYSFAELTRSLEQLATESDVEEMSVQPGRRNAVRLMNLHRAKGLESPIVFLANSGKRKEHEPTFYIDRHSETPKGYFLISENVGTYYSREVGRPLEWKARSVEEKEFQKAEEDRLLYVAATRAMNVLVISCDKQEDIWGKFLPSLTEELPVFVEPSSETNENLSDTWHCEEAEARELRQRKRAEVVQPRYDVHTVTDLATARTDVHATAATRGQGRVWGSLLHRVLEVLMKNPSLDLRLFVENWLVQQGGEDSLEFDNPTGAVDELIGVVEKVQSSDCWRRARASTECFVEIPFGLKLSAGEFGLQQETDLRGCIDLVFREEDHWVLVDFKTGTPQEIPEPYEMQLRLYRQAWQNLTGEPVKAHLFFVETGNLVEVAS